MRGKKASKAQIRVFRPSARARHASSSTRISLTIQQEQRRRSRYSTTTSRLQSSTAPETPQCQPLDDTTLEVPRFQHIDDFLPSPDNNEEPVINNPDAPVPEHQVPPDQQNPVSHSICIDLSSLLNNML